MPKLTAEEIETSIIQFHADMLAAFTLADVSQIDCDRVLVTTLRAAFTLGQDNGKATILDAAAQLLADRVHSSQMTQLERSTNVIAQWCNEGDRTLEIRSYSVRRTVFIDPEKHWCATAHAMARSREFHGASHAEALARLATWCAARIDHDGKTEPNNEAPEAPLTGQSSEES